MMGNTTEELQSLLNSAVKAGLVGVSACIANTDGVLWEGVAGLADVAGKAPIKKENIFGIGSITKVFLSVVTLQLVEEGRLSLTDKVGMYVGDNITSDIPNAATATIASLMNHTSGIPSWEDDSAWIHDGRGDRIVPSRIWMKTDCLEYIRNSEPVPPREFHYSNTNFTLLGLVVETITGSTAEAEIRSRILNPIGLSETYLEGFEQAKSEHMPRRYHLATSTFEKTAGISPDFPTVKSGVIDVSSSNLSVEWVTGGMVSRPQNLVRFAAALRDGRLLKPSSMEYMNAWTPALENANVSHGLFQFLTADGSVLGHNGGVLGFSASFWWAEHGDCITSILSNTGVMHAGNVPTSAASLAIKSKFTTLALKLSDEVSTAPK